MYYSPTTPRLRRSRSVPSMATPVRTSRRHKLALTSATTESYVGGSSIYASHLPPPFRARAYEHAKGNVYVPQTNLPSKSLANAGNLQPPPSYQHSMVKLGSESRQAWALQQTRKPEIYYYLPRTYSTGGGSYYSTYTHSRRSTPSAAYRLATKLPTTSYDRPGAYISSEPRAYSSNSDRRHRVPVGHKPVTVVETYDHLGRVSHYLV